MIDLSGTSVIPLQCANANFIILDDKFKTIRPAEYDGNNLQKLNVFTTSALVEINDAGNAFQISGDVQLSSINLSGYGDSNNDRQKRFFATLDPHDTAMGIYNRMKDNISGDLAYDFSAVVSGWTKNAANSIFCTSQDEPLLTMTKLYGKIDADGNADTLNGIVLYPYVKAAGCRLEMESYYSTNAFVKWNYSVFHRNGSEYTEAVREPENIKIFEEFPNLLPDSIISDNDRAEGRFVHKNGSVISTGEEIRQCYRWTKNIGKDFPADRRIARHFEEATFRNTNAFFHRGIIDDEMTFFEYPGKSLRSSGRPRYLYQYGRNPIDDLNALSTNMIMEQSHWFEFPDNPGAYNAGETPCYLSENFNNSYLCKNTCIVSFEGLSPNRIIALIDEDTDTIISGFYHKYADDLVTEVTGYFE